VGAELALLLDAGRLGVALQHNQSAQRVAKLARHLLPHWLALEIPETNAAIRRRFREEDPPAVFGQLDIIEMRPPGCIDAHGRAQIDLMVILEALRPHITPPIEVGRLPMLERALQALVGVEADVVRNAFARNHDSPA
jgi:hypothetical protein